MVTERPEQPSGLEHLQSLFDSVRPTNTLEDQIDHAIAANSNSIAVDLQNGIIVHAKPNAERLFGYAPGELKGHDIHDLVPPDVRGIHRVWFEEYRANPINRTMGLRGMNLRGYTKAGATFPVEIGLTSVDLGELTLAIATIIPMARREHKVEAGE